jgi:hypothetical protein
VVGTRNEKRKRAKQKLRLDGLNVAGNGDFAIGEAEGNVHMECFTIEGHTAFEL